MNSMKGYTLIELMLVFALILVFLSIAIPQVEFWGRFNEQQQIRQLKRDILYAKTQAIVKGNIHEVSYDIINNNYIIKENVNVLKRVNLENGLKFVYTSSDTVISFSRTGAPLKSGTIILENKNKKKYTITITPVVGKVNIKVQ
ncbi:MAG: prepilin-type N-terminal cleavage/methylation domain-containing protein [Tissierellia bacterium]|nr:prepilin-type N-terminal cleavage/methylation domain-containing protein [Tissierellia bacterium]